MPMFTLGNNNHDQSNITLAHNIFLKCNQYACLCPFKFCSSQGIIMIAAVNTLRGEHCIAKLPKLRKLSGFPKPGKVCIFHGSEKG